MSKKYSLNKADFIEILQVLGWTVASTVVAVLISVLAELEIPMQYAFLVPIANTVLYTAQRFIASKQ